jgi:cell division protein FtsB
LPAIKSALSVRPHVGGMVTRKRLRSILTALGLYIMAALLIGYFGVNAFSGDHGLKAKQDIDQQIAALSTELGRLQVERGQWQRRIALLKSDRLDPDMLDERARALLDYAQPNDLTLMLHPSQPAADRLP